MIEPSTPGQVKVMAAVQAAVAAQERLFVWWMGGVRSGKSFGAALAFMEHQRHRTGRQYLILAYTQTQALSIYGKYFEAIGESMGYTMKVVSGARARIDVKETGNTFLIKGADVKGRDKAIQGLTVDGLLADEIVLLERNTLHQAEARVSGKAGLRIYTSNKANEYHWSTKYYPKRIQDGIIDGIIVDSPVADNPHIDADYIAERENEFTGNTLKRFMNNEFTLDGSPIYNVGIGDPGNPDRVKPYVAVYSEPTGHELLMAELQQVNGTTVLRLTGAVSLGPEADVADWIAGHYRGREAPSVLLNQEAPLQARWIRRAGFPLQGYRTGYNPRVAEVLTKACSQARVWVQEDQQTLIEALRTHYQPAAYQFPIMMAFEGFAGVLRSAVLPI